MEVLKDVFRSSHKSNDMESFFENFEPLQSFEDVDPGEYVENIRLKSRILEK